MNSFTAFNYVAVFLCSLLVCFGDIQSAASSRGLGSVHGDLSCADLAAEGLVTPRSAGDGVAGERAQLLPTPNRSSKIVFRVGPDSLCESRHGKRYGIRSEQKLYDSLEAYGATDRQAEANSSDPSGGYENLFFHHVDMDAFEAGSLRQLVSNGEQDRLDDNFQQQLNNVFTIDLLIKIISNGSVYLQCNTNRVPQGIVVVAQVLDFTVEGRIFNNLFLSGPEWVILTFDVPDSTQLRDELEYIKLGALCKCGYAKEHPTDCRDMIFQPLDGVRCLVDDTNTIQLFCDAIKYQRAMQKLLEENRG